MGIGEKKFGIELYYINYNGDKFSTLFYSRSSFIKGGITFQCTKISQICHCCETENQQLAITRKTSNDQQLLRCAKFMSCAFHDFDP